MLGSAAIGGQHVAATAARDALFLANFEASSLPPMIIVAAMFSIALVLATSWGLRHVSPASWLPVVSGGMAVLIVADWALAASAPGLAARILFILVSGFGPMLGSGFWLIATERFDPHTAKKVFGRVAGAGTLGGILAGLGAARVAAIGDVRAMLLLLAGLGLTSAWFVRRLAKSPDQKQTADAGPATAPPTRSGFRVLADTRYLRHVAALVLLGTVAAVFVDQAFKTQVRADLGNGPELGSFFSLYYAALSLVTFVVQTGASRYALEKFGLSVAAGTPALTFLVGGAAALLFPGLRTLVLTRAGEAVLRASIFRPGYELFYTPIAADDKRAVKPIIDVGVDRTGDIVGATVTQRLLSIPQPRQTMVLVALAMGCAGVALIIARRLTRGYTEALERSLLTRAVELDLAEVEDVTTRTTMLRAMQKSGMGASVSAPCRPGMSPPPGRPGAAIAGSDIGQIVALQSREPERVRRVLRGGRLSAAVLPHVIPLLAWDAVSRDCIRALQSVAEERVGELVDALIDPNQPFAVRRRLARVFSVCVSQRAAEGLLLGLEDLRFEVRYRCGRSLVSIVEKNPAVKLDPARIFGYVNREIAVSREVWEKRRLLDGFEDGDDRPFLEDLVRDRASRSLAHVFTLLALVLPTEPLRIAFRGLHTDDQDLKGTALEYLDSVLPREIRDRLWSFLEERPMPGRARRPRAETLTNLLHSNESIQANLEALKRRAAAARGSGS